MTELNYISKESFDIIINSDCPRELRVAMFAEACRINALYMIARAGSGHIGSSFSSLDIVSWIYLEELKKTINPETSNIYFSSKGHDVPGLYSVLLALGVLDFEKLHCLRRLGGLPGHPDVSTPGIESNTGSLGMGISKAKGMALANRLRGVDSEIFVLTGDGELQEGQFWESLVSAVNMGLSEITVIVDHNKLQSDIWVRQTSDLGDLEGKFSAFGWQVQRVDGHDFGALSDAIALARDEKERPSVIIADTIKGKGVSFMEHRVSPSSRDLYKFHSGAPSQSDYIKALDELLTRLNLLVSEANIGQINIESVKIEKKLSAETNQNLPAAYADVLVELGQSRQDLVALSADLKLDCGLIPFESRFPNRFVECGIAEQDMVSMAGGMALKGLLPVVHSFACFLSARPNEQIYNNATEKKKVIYVGFLAGLLPAGPGHSHQSVRDISALGAMPGLVMFQPCCEAELRQAMKWAVMESNDSVYMRITQIPCNISFSFPANNEISLGRGSVLREGRDIAIIAYGPIMLEQALQAAKMLDENGISAKVINLPWLNKIDSEWICDVVSECEHVFTVDDHFVSFGQGFLLSSILKLKNKNISVYNIGVEGIPSCGSSEEVLRCHKMDSICIFEYAYTVWNV